jgi:hypothetical protein
MNSNPYSVRRFARDLVILVVLSLAVGGVIGATLADAAGATGKDKDHKVVICHVPPGNPDNAHTIEVDKHGWNGHKNHDLDYEGACVIPDPEPEPEPEVPPTTVPPVVTPLPEVSPELPEIPLVEVIDPEFVEPTVEVAPAVEEEVVVEELPVTGAATRLLVLIGGSFILAGLALLLSDVIKSGRANAGWRRRR